MTSTYTVVLPGRFYDWLRGTEMLGGGDDQHPDLKAARIACESGATRRAGAGYSRTVTVSAAVMDVLREYAGYCLSANRDEPDPGEVKAAREVIKRIDAHTVGDGAP